MGLNSCGYRGLYQHIEHYILIKRWQPYSSFSSNIYFASLWNFGMIWFSNELRELSKNQLRHIHGFRPKAYQYTCARIWIEIDSKKGYLEGM